jgi:hypothetical protein
VGEQGELCRVVWTAVKRDYLRWCLRVYLPYSGLVLLFCLITIWAWFYLTVKIAGGFQHSSPISTAVFWILNRWQALAVLPLIGSLAVINRSIDQLLLGMPAVNQSSLTDCRLRLGSRVMLSSLGPYVLLFSTLALLKVSSFDDSAASVAATSVSGATRLIFPALWLAALLALGLRKAGFVLVAIVLFFAGDLNQVLADLLRATGAVPHQPYADSYLVDHPYVMVAAVFVHLWVATRLLPHTRVRTGYLYGYLLLLLMLELPLLYSGSSAGTHFASLANGLGWGTASHAPYIPLYASGYAEKTAAVYALFSAALITWTWLWYVALRRGVLLASKRQRLHS